MNKDFKPVLDLLEEKNKPLSYIYRKIRLHQQLFQQLKVYFEPRFHAEIEIANVTGSTLTLLTTTGTVAGQLRYQSAELVRKFKLDPNLRHIDLIEFKVSAALNSVRKPYEKEEPVSQMAWLSKNTAKELQDVAAEITDPKLRAVFERIATRVKE